MGYKIYFDNFKQMKHFIDYISDFNDWQCKKLTLTNIQGSVVDVNTKQYTSVYGTTTYVNFGQIKSTIDVFIERNNNSAIRLDLKLIYPKELLTYIDVNNTLNNVYVAFYSYNDENSYLNCGFEEFGGSILHQSDEENIDEEKDILLAYSGFVANIQNKYDTWKVYYDTYL